MAPPGRPQGRALPPDLTKEWLGYLLECALPAKDLRAFLHRVGLSFPGFRVEKMNARQMAEGIAAEYEAHPDFQPEVEALLARGGEGLELPGRLTAPVAAALVDAAAGEPRDALIPLAIRFLLDPRKAIQEEGMQALHAHADWYERQWEKGAESVKHLELPKVEEVRRREEELQRRIASEEEHARGIAETLAGARREVGEKNESLAALRRELHASQEEARKLRAEADVLREEVRRAAGPREHRLAAEEARRDLESAREEIENLKRRNAELAVSAREAAGRPAEPAPAPAPEEPPEGEDADLAVKGFTVPVFTREFYDSLRGWDHRTLRIAFKNALLLAANPNHPSLDTKVLQGVEGLFRIRIATDVRLLFRRGEGGTYEILSLIDREDLQRYVNQYKTRA